MKKTVILHIGMHKTATTSIQDTLYVNRNKLKRANIFYPKAWRQNHAHILCSILWTKPDEYYMNKMKRFSKEQIEEFNNRMTDIHVKELKNVKKDNILISGEGLCLLSKADTIKLKQFYENILGDIDFKVIACFREHVSYINSAIQQVTKNGGILVEKTKHADIYYNDLYKKKVEQYIDVFGKENITCYKFEDACKYNLGPVGYFLKVINIPEKDIDKYYIAKSNESASDKSIDLIAFINKEARDRGYTNIRQIDTKPLRSIKGNKFMLNTEFRKYLYEFTRKDAKWLNDTFGIDYTGDIEIKDSEQELVFDEQYRNDLMNVYDGLKPEIKILIKDYIKSKLEIDKYKDNNVLAELMNDLD